MSDNRDFGFCPRCGALMQDGTCRSCGYTSRASAQPNVPGNGEAPGGFYGSGGPYGQPYQQPYHQGAPYMQPVEKKKSHKGLFITLGVIGGVILLILLILAVSYFFSAVGNFAGSIEDGAFGDTYDEYYDDFYDDYYDDYGYYEPSEDDPYYREIVDAVRTDLDYQLAWNEESITPADEEDYCTYYTTYPVLSREDADFSEINARIAGAAHAYRDTYMEYSGGCSTWGYVTYMDEEQISVVFDHRIYGEDGTLPHVTALTFDLETGRELAPEEMTELDSEFAMRFRAQNETQNGPVEYLDAISDEELLSTLQDPENAFYFYSPVGLEAGFNYDSEEYGAGWVSVTLKELSL